MPFGKYENFEDCVSKNQDKSDPAAYCAAIKRQIEGDFAQRRVGFDTTTLDDKIITDDDEKLVIPTVIASEIVQQYDDGWAYKSAGELKKMSQAASRVGALPVKILEHPGADTNYLLLKQSDLFGKMDNFSYVKNLTDPKTGRPNRRGVKADVTWFKDTTPEKVIQQIKSRTMTDVSIGFTFDSDLTPGVFKGTNYDYMQRNIFLNHLAAPIAKGRCPGPVCGIGFDADVRYGFDEATLLKCPVCRGIKNVGMLVAGKRLFKRYGLDVIDVIEGIPVLPPVKVKKPKPQVKVDDVDLTGRYEKSFGELAKHMKN